MITSIKISGFRGVTSELPFVLGKITLLTGRNGLGKTTLFDAVDWCLFGSSWRLGFDVKSIRNIYHPELEPTVKMEIRLPNETFLLERNSESALLNGSRISDRDLIETLMTDPGIIAPYTRDIERQVRRVVYLSQEDIRAFVHADSATEQKALFQALLGVPNASVMQSGVRRISEHFRQREQEMRLHLGQLHVKNEELDSALHDAKIETIDTAQIVSEAAQVLNVSATLALEDLTHRSRRTLDALTVESIQLDEAMSSIGTFRERRRIDAAETERLSREIQSCTADETAGISANNDATQKLTSARMAKDERQKALNTALVQQKQVQETAAIHRRIEELATLEAELKTGLGVKRETAEYIRGELERLRHLSDVALDRRQVSALKRSELETIRDHARRLRESQREESELLTKTKLLADRTVKENHDRDSLQVRLRVAREELTRRVEEFTKSSKTASRSEALEALLRQAVSMFPPELRECPLCGSPFTSRQELLQHVSQTREQYTVASDVLGKALGATHEQQEVINQLERDLLEMNRTSAATESEKSKCDDSLQRIRATISALPADISSDTDGQIELVDQDLQSINEELKTLKNEIEDKAIRVGVTQDEVSRGSARLESVVQELLDARRSANSSLPVSNLEQQAKETAEAVFVAKNELVEATSAENVASQNESATRAALNLLTRRVSELNSKIFAVQERGTAQAATLLRQLSGQIQDAKPLEEVIDTVQRRRAEVSDGLVTIKRIWSELLAAGSEERAKAIRMQKDVLAREITEVQYNLELLLHAHTRFKQVSEELQNTSESEAVNALKHQRDAIQECFTAIYPHDHLNKVIVGDEPFGEILVTDNRLSRPVRPSAYLSTGQANVLGLSIFVGIALRQRLLKIGILCLDEPIQHLDDLHFLGFVSLLKRIGLSRQVVLSTADSNVSEIITRQMRSSWIEQQNDFVIYDWHSFEPRTGPAVSRRSGTIQAVA